MHAAEATIQRYQDVSGGWRWRLVAADGHVLADGARVLDSRDKLDDHLDDIAEHLSTERDVMARFRPTRGANDEWRWTLDVDGEVVAESGEGYASEDRLERAVAVVESALPTAQRTVWGR